MRSIAQFGLAAILAVAAPALFGLRSQPMPERQFDGFNVIATPGNPFGSVSARRALANAKSLGARAIAVVPFEWQSSPASPDLVRGHDMTDAELRLAIRDAHALGLAVLMKPQVWVPGSWAGAIFMDSDEAWKQWFAHYQGEMERIARIANDEAAEAIAIGTELDRTTHRSEWNGLIDSVRGLYSGRLLYVAHNAEGADQVPFWDRLDFIGVSLYPSLGDDDDRAYRLSAMRTAADRLDMLAARAGKSIVVGEIGLRSAEAAAAKPWESAEERNASPDPLLQANVLGDWLAVLDRPTIKGVLVWRWFTDPNAGGLTDTDFTVQGKPAARVLMCAWTQECERDVDGPRSP